MCVFGFQAGHSWATAVETRQWGRVNHRYTIIIIRIITDTIYDGNLGHFPPSTTRFWETDHTVQMRCCGLVHQSTKRLLSTADASWVHYSQVLVSPCHSIYVFIHLFIQNGLVFTLMVHVHGEEVCGWGWWEDYCDVWGKGVKRSDLTWWDNWKEFLKAWFISTRI